MTTIPSDTPEQRLDECQPRVDLDRLRAALMALAGEAGLARASDDQTIEAMHAVPEEDRAQPDATIPVIAAVLLRLIDQRERAGREVALRMGMAGELAWIGEARGA